MTIEMQQRAAEIVEAYRGAQPRYIRGRMHAAEIQATDARLTPGQVAYWHAIADGCRALLVA